MWATVDVLGSSSHALHNRGQGVYIFLFEEAHDSCCLEAKTWKHLETTQPFVCSRTDSGKVQKIKSESMWDCISLVAAKHISQKQKIEVHIP